MTRRVVSLLLAGCLLAALAAAPTLAHHSERHDGPASGKAFKGNKPDKPSKPGKPKPEACTDDSATALPLTLTVEGEPATGHYALPTKRPEALVVFAHGYGHTSYSWIKHMEAVADRGVAAVTMDYRGLTFLPDDDGDGLPGSRGWPAQAGAEDLVAAAQYFDAQCRFDEIAIFGVSMGGNMSGLAVALAGEQGLTKFDSDEPLFDYWFDIEGAVNLIETYTEARALAPGNAFAARAYQDIKAETGGDIEQQPQAFADRAVVNRVDDIAAANLDGVVVVHGLNDGLVPYNQSRELVPLLVAHQIPTEMFNVTTRDGDSEKETTATGYVTDNVDKAFTAPLAGHASEKSSTHIIMNVAFDRLFAAVLDGDAPQQYFEYLVYGVFNDPADTEPHYVPEP